MMSNLTHVDSDPFEKRLKTEGIDHISNMPNEILAKILSHMNTKYAIGTKVLSKRWKTLSPFEAPHIKLDLHEINRHKFISFVDKLLSVTLCAGPSVETVFIRCRGNYHLDDFDYKFVEWVKASLRLRVVNLILDIKLIDRDLKDIVHTLNGCITLVDLQLMSRSIMDYAHFRVPEDFALPKLKSLSLFSMALDASFKALIDGCPMLTELSFKNCKFSDNLYIKFPLLKLLVIHFREFGGEVVFDAPNIEVLVYEGNGYYIPHWVGADFKSLRSAYICISVYHGPRRDYSLCNLAKIIRACSSAARLCLLRDSITALQFVEHSMFRNLTWLGIDNMDNQGEVLASILNNVPTLQTLAFDEFEELNHKTSGLYARFESLLPSIPISLKKIEFMCFDWIEVEDQVKLVEYFLKNGRGLQEVRLQYYRGKDTTIFDRLLTLPKHSQTCQILTFENQKYDHFLLLGQWLTSSNLHAKVLSFLRVNY